MQGKQIERYKIIGELGDGSFAKVYAVQDTRGHQLAAKVISMKHKKEYALDFMREAMLQMSMEHPNLLKAYRAFVRCEQLEMVIITDICEGGSLSKSIANLNGPAQQQIMLGLSEGLAYLHNERKIIHRDIKLENILLKGGVAKIADFGLSRFTPKNAQTQSGTQVYMAPEMISSQEYDNLVDIWALGIVFLEIILRKRISRLVASKPYMYDSFPTQEILSAIPSQNARALLVAMLKKNPRERVRIETVVDYLKSNVI